MPGTLFVVATPIGNLDDITMRALRVLREVAIIAAEDTRRTAHLLARYAIPTKTTSLREHNEASKTGALLARLRRGESVALVSDAGTPTVSDPGQQLIQRAIDAGFRIESIPGPSAVVTALAASGFPADTFTFLGYPPIRSNDRFGWMGSLRSAGRTVIFFEAPHRIRETLQQILIIVGDCDGMVGREMTKTHENFVRGPISAIAERLPTPRGEFTVVLNLGQTINNVPSTVQAPIQGQTLLRELGEIMSESSLPRRRAINLLARKYGLTPNYVYGEIEKAKKWVV